MKPVVFNNTVLRDGHQSMAATRMRTSQMLPAAPILDSMGFGMLETWGGATIDTMLRFLGEQPFDRVRALRKAAPNTPQGMLLRGQNIVQYKCFPDDVVELFVKCTADSGIEVFRIFDGLNDPRNLAPAIAAVVKSGKEARGEICYTTSPVHTTEAFVKFAGELKEMGCQSIGIKDMSGVITPHAAAELTAAIKKLTGLPVTLHSHDTAGLAASAYLAAIDAGVDRVETSITPFANGTSQPDTLRMLALLDGHARLPDYDRKKLAELRDYFTTVYKEMEAFTSTANQVVDSDTLVYQVPGGMLSNFRVQLKDLNMSDRINEVLAEIPHVRKCLGWAPLVTPISQIVGTQAMLNVKFGRWKNFSPAAMDIILGFYGKTPGEVDPEVRALAEKNTGKSPLSARPADGLKPQVEEFRKQLADKGLPTTDEAVVLFAMFPMEYEKLIKDPGSISIGAPKKAAAAPAAAAPAPAAAPASRTGRSQRMVITINGKTTEALVEEVH
jgi:oxaloacetate decarboxylase alpha subunit/pyruvate carboxylase subunit B